MWTLRSLPALRRAARGRRIGFVPTMGALHEGHLSLVRRAARENQAVVVSIFVNPAQFGRGEDFKRYPRNLRRDKALLRKEKKVRLFLPREKDFYAKDFQTSVAVEALSQPLCGRFRPGHFKGVATVMVKLLNSVQPDTLYLGQKDYQQYRVIRQLVKDLDFPVRVRLVPTVREPDGLAMSSRNVFLSRQARREAVFLYRALLAGRRMIRAGHREARRVKRAMRERFRAAPHARWDYLEIVDAGSLRPVVKLRAGKRVLLAVAGRFGKTRLIDNILVRV